MRAPVAAWGVPTFTTARPAAPLSGSVTARDERPATVPCPTCGDDVAERFCGRCGEPARETRDLSMRAMLRDLVEHVTSLDTVVLRSLRTLVARPGALTEAYLRGSRVRFTRPLQLFLLVNVFFFFAARPLGVLRFDLAAVRRAPTGNAWLLERAERARLRRAEPVAAFDARFNAAMEDRKRGLFAALVPAFALSLAIVHARRRRYFAEHLVFALHFYAFLMAAVIAIATVVVAAGAAWEATHARGAPVPGIAFWRLATTLAMAGIPGAHLFLALRRTYGGSATSTLAATAAILAGVIGSWLLYGRALLALTALTL